MNIEEFTNSNTYASVEKMERETGLEHDAMDTVVMLNRAGWMYGEVNGMYYVYNPLAVSRVYVESKL